MRTSTSKPEMSSALLARQLRGNRTACSTEVSNIPSSRSSRDTFGGGTIELSTFLLVSFHSRLVSDNLPLLRSRISRPSPLMITKRFELWTKQVQSPRSLYLPSVQVFISLFGSVNQLWIYNSDSLGTCSVKTSDFHPRSKIRLALLIK